MPFLLLFPIYLLLMQPSVPSIICWGFIYLVCAFLLLQKGEKVVQFNLRRNIISIILAALMGCAFYAKWSPSSKVMAIAAHLHLSHSVFLTMCAAFLAVLSVPGLVYLQKIAGKIVAAYNLKFGSAYSVSNNIEARKPNPKGYIFLLAVAIITVSVCSTSSPLYAFNKWFDSNEFFTIGKSMLKGLVPYKDLFEQKGPLLYVLHALAALISVDSFLGVYFIECASCFAFLIFAYRFFMLFFDNSVIYALPLLAGVVYSSKTFEQGDSAEELCLPLLMYALYVVVKAIVRNEIPDNKDFFWIGVTSACVLWIKYTMLGFYLGWIVAPVGIALSQKRPLDLIKRGFSLLGGILVATVPFVVYFVRNNAFYDWLEVYFYDNIFLYSSDTNSAGGILQNIRIGINSIDAYFFWGLCLIILGLLWCASLDNKWLLIEYASTNIMLFLLVFGGGRHYQYYALAFGSLTVFGLGAVWEVYLYFKTEIKRNWIAKASCILCFVALLTSSPNIEQMQYSKEDYPQYQVKNVIEQSGIENPSLLNYDFLDGGFYTVTGIYPSIKYFCKNNIPLDDMMEQQNECVDNGEVDFIVTNSEREFEKYQLVGTCSCWYGKFYLYQLSQIES